MSHVQIHRDADGARTLPVFRELADRLEAVRKRAFDRFAMRGGEPGHELEDWVTAEREILGWPVAELKERNGSYEIDVTLPGFSPRDIDVTATPKELIVHAVSTSDRSGDDSRVLWSEFGQHEVYRRIEFPTAINADRISANLDHGVLHLKAPKSAPSASPSDLPAGATLPKSIEANG